MPRNLELKLKKGKVKKNLTSEEKKVSEIGELELVKKIKAKSPPNRRALIGIGDDAAVVRWGENRLLVLTTDSFVEDIHFSLSWASFRDIGYKTLAATLSDLAAMAAEPAAFLVSLGIPPDYRVKAINELYDGFFDLASDFNVELLGGDTVASEVFFISLTACGFGVKKMLRTRGEAKAGERVLVTGNLGHSALGLKALEKGILPNSKGFEVFSPFIEAHLRPYPRIKEAQLLSQRGARAMEDISDGLASEIIHIAEESKVGIEIYCSELPVGKNFQKAAGEVGADPIELVLYGGEDYELVFTAPEEKMPLIFAEAKKIGLKITEVGRVTEDQGAWLVINGERKVLKPGYEHFKV